MPLNHSFTGHYVSNWSRSAIIRRGCLTSHSAPAVNSDWESYSTLVLPAPVAPIGSASNVVWYPKIPLLPSSVLCVSGNGQFTNQCKVFKTFSKLLCKLLHVTLQSLIAMYTWQLGSTNNPIYALISLSYMTGEVRMCLVEINMYVVYNSSCLLFVCYLYFLLSWIHAL